MKFILLRDDKLQRFLTVNQCLNTLQKLPSPTAMTFYSARLLERLGDARNAEVRTRINYKPPTFTRESIRPSAGTNRTRFVSVPVVTDTSTIIQASSDSGLTISTALKGVNILIRLLQWFAHFLSSTSKKQTKLYRKN
jgi:hypothetical protein